METSTKWLIALLVVAAVAVIIVVIVVPVVLLTGGSSDMTVELENDAAVSAAGHKNIYLPPKGKKSNF
jgi:hypothetical protein